MCQAQQKRRDAQMPAVIEKWKKTTIQPAQWADTQHNIQQQEGGRSKRANQQRLGGRTLWLLCLAVALVVSAGHLLTAEPRRKRLAALLQSQAEQPPPEASTTSLETAP